MIQKKRSGLGKGLSALLSDTESTQNNENSRLVGEPGPVKPGIDQILISQIETNPFQPRTHFDEDALNELAESIRIQGIIQPITVRQLSANQYQLISGERRFQASKKIGLESVPAYVRTANDQQMLEMALIENIQRENLNSLEIALSYQRLIAECNLKQEELGDRVGKKRTTINNYLRLLKLPPEIQAGIRDGQVSMGHARALVNVEFIEDQLFLFKKIIREQWSVRQIEEAVRKLSEREPGKPGQAVKIRNQAAALDAVRQKLSSHFGTKVAVKEGKGEKGEIRIPYMSHNDLNRLLELLRL
ncbi:MAG TPA: ParB/RepB/Spo0J family partition protein [Catalimonadaceae bacterium]|jgi:ParB family chromosome partitioning protein|nr:ParB/RepB/Spo0J family partition protein [Catalimonadaceae bacterium]